MRNDNRKEVSIDKVQWCRLVYSTTDEQHKRDRKPTGFTAHGLDIDPKELAAPHPSYPHETMLERATRLDILDTWVPVCIAQLTANHSLQFTGDKALSFFKAWKAHIYGRKEN
jgi:hypothetical protein